MTAGLGNDCRVRSAWQGVEIRRSGCGSVHITFALKLLNQTIIPLRSQALQRLDYIVA